MSKHISATEAKQAAAKIVKEIETAMQQDIESLSMDERGDQAARVGKTHAVANKIGYPDHWRDY